MAWPVPIGKLILIKLVKKKPEKSAEVDWFPAKVEVESPNGETHIFPIYRWITDSVEQSFREGTGIWKLAFLTSCKKMSDHRIQVLQAGLLYKEVRVNPCQL